LSENDHAVTIEGDVSGQVAAGTNVTQTQTRHQESTRHRIKILFLAANPEDTSELRLGEEVRTIDERLRTADYRDDFELVQHWAVRATDLSEALLRHRPQVLHFSGHGSEAGALILEDEAGLSAEVTPSALARLFRTAGRNLKCVVLNACYSATQAEPISRHVDCVVGTSLAIGDKAAIRFAGGFYRALAYGESFQTSFELGCNEIELAALDEETTPRLLHRDEFDPAAQGLVPGDG
jgi:hypothetical protein